MKATLLLIGVSLTTTLFGQNTLSLQTDAANITIEKEIYGHFSEHLGTCIYEGIYVGEDSEIPNIDGYRKDVVEALKALKVPVLRWPGGCFADTYHWKDGIGPKDERPSIVNVFWGGVTEDNSFGTHEFLNFCELIDAEPYLSINVGSGTVQEARDWVEYVTSNNQSPMTDLRKKNGREEPWKVKFWGIGNENWGCGGDMAADYYANIFRNYSSYIKGADFQKVICGPAGNDVAWTETILSGLKNKTALAQGLSLHYYTLPTGDWDSKGSSTDFGEDMWFRTLRNTLYIEDYIQQHLAIMDQYDPDRTMKLMVDEWGTWYDQLPGTQDGFLQQQNTLRDALVAGMNLNIFNNYAERIRMANIAQIVNVLQSVIRTNGPQMVRTPTYYVFQLYNVHQDAMLIPTELTTENYEYKGEAIPALSASASIKDDVISISITNANPHKAISVSCTPGREFTAVSGKIVNGDAITDYNDFGMEERVLIKDFEIEKTSNQELEVEIPAHSVVLLQLQVR
ncbi:alpha-N-arabinofuranosidase [Flavobacteriaceae bacterium TP-CH-4]|uniref:non-reducing end alpha-L-arabinofuranosidase n=1 Tax=Pelagihabitans pacificus TaxID=2696054 RepID=A0A967E6Y3_9FLAO|nr:alpha-L-arabinofuranosidase C-terminal domain-containing protein [Pelagihabitans pacificus]NHF60105.1 alpha-N-arabinofuranosidase [Pelagihabitans pacificus]